MSRKLLILMDVDGIVADFDSHFLKAYRQVTGIKLDYKILSHYDLISCMPRKKKFKQKLKAIINKPGWGSKIQPYPGAVKAVKDIMRDHNVVFVTAPSFKNKTWTHDRQNWLKKHFGEDVKVIHTKHKYLVQGDVFLDDKAENVAEWGEWNIQTPVIWDKLYNRESTALRVNSWKQFNKLLKEVGSSAYEYHKIYG